MLKKRVIKDINERGLNYVQVKKEIEAAYNDGFNLLMSRDEYGTFDDPDTGEEIYDAEVHRITAEEASAAWVLEDILEKEFFEELEGIADGELLPFSIQLSIKV